MTQPTTEESRGDTLDLGTITLRLLAVAEQTNGAFTFTLGTEKVQAGPGSFIVVPRGTRHELRAAPGGGRLLTLWVPGGTEAMFVELSRMPPGSLRDPEVRKKISARHDSIPV